MHIVQHLYRSNNIYLLALTSKICGILSKKLQKLALLKLIIIELVCQNNRILLFFDIPQILQI